MVDRADKIISDFVYSPEVWKDKIEKSMMPDVPLAEIEKGQAEEDISDFYEGFLATYPKFVSYIAHKYYTELFRIGIEDKDILYMKKSIIPKNYTVSLKVPYIYGGTYYFENLLFIQKLPFAEVIYNFTREQINDFDGRIKEALQQKAGGEIKYFPEKLFLPYPKGPIFIPAFNGVIGKGGGNTATDRLTEEAVAAQEEAKQEEAPQVDNGRDDR
jgi:hypothetical protein